jgi:hypothetical protein
MLLQLKKLETVGYDSMLVLYNKTDGSAVKCGTDKGLSFLKCRGNVAVDFAQFVGGGKQLSSYAA